MLLVGGAVAWCLWPRTLSPDECSAIYRHYATVEGVDATYIKDKQIGDGDKVDVTYLHAVDSMGWATLLHDLDMPDFEVEPGDDFFIHYLAAKEHPEQRVPFAPGLCDLVVLWPAESSVCVFHIATEAHYDRLLKYQFDNLEQ